MKEWLPKTTQVDRHGTNIWGKMWIYSCTHQLPPILHPEEAYLLTLKYAGTSQRIRKCSPCTNTKHTHRILCHCWCDCVKQAVTYQGLFNWVQTFVVTLDNDSDTPTANALLTTINTNYSDTTYSNITFTLLPNVLRNSKTFPSKSSTNGRPFSSCKHMNIMDIWFNQGAFTRMASKEGTQPTLISHSNDRWQQSTVWFQLDACTFCAGSIPDGVIGIFQWHNSSGRTMALGSTQPLTEMSTRCISWG